MEFFEIQDDMPIIRPAVRNIEAFKVLIARDKNRKKPTAIKELAYIYFTHDYLSPYFNYSSSERDSVLRENLNMPSNWKIDKIMKRALDTYKALRETTSLKFLRETVETMHASASTLVLLREQLEASVRAIQNSKPMEVAPREDFPEGDTGRQSHLEQLKVVMEFNAARGDLIHGTVKSVQELLSLSKNIPSAIGNLQDLEGKIKMELAQGSKIRGGGDIGEFEK